MNKNQVEKVMQQLKVLIDKKPFKHISNVDKFVTEIKGYENNH